MWNSSLLQSQDPAGQLALIVPQIVAHFPFDVLKDSFHLFIFAVKLLHLVPCASQILRDIIPFSKQGSGTWHLNDSKLGYLPVTRARVAGVLDFTPRHVLSCPWPFGETRAQGCGRAFHLLWTHQAASCPAGSCVHGKRSPCGAPDERCWSGYCLGQRISSVTILLFVFF